MDTSKLQRLVDGLESEIVTFLREFIAIPSPSGQEKEAADFLLAGMQKLGFDEVFRDSIGNVAGRVGNGKTIILYDAHMDTVEAGDPSEWGFDPFKGKYENGIIYGRGASDDKGCLTAMAFAGKAIKELELLGDFTLYVVGVVGEEVGEGKAIQSFLEETGIRPHYVIIGEASNLRLCRGHKGRALLKVTVPGRAGHASAPERADNALSKAAALIQEVDRLPAQFTEDPFLGKGTIVATKVECKTPSLNTIPGECTLYLDRRLTVGETKELCLDQVRDIAAPFGAEVEILQWEAPGYTGKPIGGEEFFPAWSIPEEHPLVKVAAEVFRQVLGREPVIGRWDFSTDGTYTAGIAGIPTLGFGPGSEEHPHTTRDQISVPQLLEALKFYACLPRMLAEGD